MDLKVRDRFDEFAERRAEVQKENGASPSATGRRCADELLVVPLWSRLPADLQENTAALSRQIAELSAQHALFLKPKLRNEDEEGRLRAAIDRQAVEIQTSLKKLEHIIVVGTQLKSSYVEEEVRMVKSVQMQLTAQLKELALQFKSTQELFGAQLRRREKKSCKYMKIGTDAAYDVVQQEERTSRFLEMGFTDQDVQSLLIEEMQRDQTNKEVKDILDSIHELHNMFEDLHTMVIDHGTMLDRIDYNVDRALVSASKAQIELEKARESQGSCILL
ncbi:putative QA-SNARE protein [Novymonas esmeraldas]|uniref:QA-SNARE protein n=1 Tax=Novymonas esmeraldas TaxID=1808958 RepID=A0AAW0EUX5_9TRYP